MTLTEAMAVHPVVAILRGLPPEEVEGIAGALLRAGVRVIEIPMNGARALEALEVLVACAGDRALVGAGTVMSGEQVRQIAERGGRLIVSPHTDAQVIHAAKAHGCTVVPGVATATEAFAALRHGADGLKLFPASALGVETLSAWRAVIPPEVPVLAVGGVRPESAQSWRDAGAAGFGVGSGVWRPGDTPAQVEAKARAFLS